MNIKMLMTTWSRIRDGLMGIIDRFSSEDLGFTAFANGFSVRRLMLHIAHEEYGEIQYGLIGKLQEWPEPFPESEFQTIESIKTLLEEIHGGSMAYLKTLDDHQLELDFEAQWGETRPLADFVFHVMEHEIHHRGELSLILGLLGREGLDA